MYVLHYYPDTASLILRLVLQELGVPHEYRLIDRAGGELTSSAYRALQPLGKIPVLETPDGPMFETAAMLLYLSERHGKLAPQPGTPARAAFLKWFFFTSTNLYPTLLHYFYPDRVAGAACAEAVKAAALDNLKNYLSLLDAMVARDAPEWLSAEPSVLGYFLAVLMRWLADACPAADYPALRPILAALETRPAALAAAAAEGLGARIFTHPA